MNRFFLTLLALLPAVTAVAATPPPADLGALLAEAEEKSPALLAASARLEALRRAPSQARVLPDPEVTLAYTNDGLSSFTLGDSEFANLALTWRQEVPYPGKRGQAEEVAKESTQISEIDFARVKLEVAAAVKSAYADLYRLDRAAAFLDETRLTLDMLVEGARSRYQVGEGIQESILKAQTEVLKLEVEKARVTGERKVVEARLNAMLGRVEPVAIGEVAILPTAVLPDDPRALEETAIAASPLVAGSQATVRRADSQAQLARLDLKPDLIWSAAYMNRGGLDPMVMGLLGLRLPLHRGKKQEQPLLQAESESTAARQDLVELQVRTRASVRELMARFERADRLVTLYGQGVVPQAMSTLESARASYGVGRLPFLDLLTDAVTLLEARIAWTAEESERLQALAALEPLLARELIHVSGGSGRKESPMTQPASPRLARAALLVVLGGLAMVAVVQCKNGDRLALSGAPGSESAATPKTLYHCPMHPTMVSDKPGDCPICAMRMVPARQSETGPSGAPAVEGLAGVRIPFEKQQLIGVRTFVARRAPMVRSLRTVGRVTVDETRLHHVHTKVGGWIETLYADATGEKVRMGQPLLSLYSPELLATQEEYLVALRSRRAMKESSLPDLLRSADDLVASARQRLLLYDLTPAQIQHLDEIGEASRTVTLYAPLTGHVIARNVSHGERIEPDTPLLDIADLSRIWVIASVYEYELPFVQVGQRATMTLAYVPGKTYRGQVALVYPVLEQATRTAQIRLEFDNSDLSLKPEMYAHVELESYLGERLSVPNSAVLSTGTRDIVFVAQGDGYFEPREVQVGLRLPDAVEILGGLAEGETVVASGNFLIDSESKLKSALQATVAAPAAPTMSAMPMPATPPTTPKVP